MSDHLGAPLQASSKPNTESSQKPLPLAAPDVGRASSASVESRVNSIGPARTVETINDCVVHTDKTHSSTLLLCPSKETDYVDKVLVNAPSLALSLLAFALSYLTFRYNTKKDARARSQSVHDDFWLRKVLSPQTVEPLLKQLGELGSALPPRPDTVYGLKQQRSASKLLTQHIEKIQALSISFSSMAVVDRIMARDCVLALERIEDLLTIHKFALEQHFTTAAPCPNVTEAWTAIMNEQIAILTAVQNYQNNALSHSGTSRFWQFWRK